MFPRTIFLPTVKRERKPNEKKHTNLPTLRVTLTEETKIKTLTRSHGFPRLTDFWRRCLETYIVQREAGQLLMWPLEFAQAEYVLIAKKPETKLETLPETKPRPKQLAARAKRSRRDAK